jgi:hypothetical protein
MDLALLVYGISLLHGVGGFFFMSALGSLFGFAFFAMWKFTETDERVYHSDKENKQRVANGVMCLKWMKTFFITGIISAWALILIPTEKTAYTMVGAYAAQKITENDKVQQMSGKVLTIIEQKLDGYIEDGIKKIEKSKQ